MRKIGPFVGKDETIGPVVRIGPFVGIGLFGGTGPVVSHTYINNYVEFVSLLLRGPYVRLIYLLNMLSSLNKDIIIIIIIIVESIHPYGVIGNG